MPDMPNIMHHRIRSVMTMKPVEYTCSVKTTILHNYQVYVTIYTRFFMAGQPRSLRQETIIVDVLQVHVYTYLVPGTIHTNIQKHRFFCFNGVDINQVAVASLVDDAHAECCRLFHDVSYHIVSTPPPPHSPPPHPLPSPPR